MNNNLPNQSYDSRIEHEIVFNKFVVGIDNTPTNWKQNLKTKIFDNIKSSQQQPFLFAITDVIISNANSFMFNINSTNNLFSYVEYDESPTPNTQILNIKIPIGNYTINKLCEYISVQMNILTWASGHYEVNNLNPFIQILYVPSSVSDTYSFSLRLIVDRTALMEFTYILLGLENFGENATQDMTGTDSITLANPNDCLLITCDKLRYATQIASNDKYTNITNQTLLMIPYGGKDVGETDFLNYNPKELNWVQTLGFPFENVINWRIVDIYGNEFQASEDFTIKFVLNIQTIGNIKVI